MYWELALSLALFRFNRVGRARRYFRRAQESWQRGEVLGATPHALAAAILAPEVAFYVGVYPTLRDRATGVWRTALDRLGHVEGEAPQTAAYLDRTDAWSDGWVGPRLVVSRDTEGPVQAVGVRGWAYLRYLRRPLVLTLRVDNQVIGRHRIGRPGDFVARLPLAGPLAPGRHTVEVEASTWFVTHRFTRNGDFRPLAWRLGEVELEAASSNP
jgi:hypothetical protein